MSMYVKFIKPLGDKVAAVILLAMSLPLMAPVMVVLALAQQGKVFFVQQRPGKKEKAFRLIKLRTMNELKNKEGILLPDEHRLTTIGKLVRKSSLDEIPQLINVLKGDMSIVGPRPLLMDYLSLYNKQQRRRHEVKPGITGWAQVHGRNTLNWPARFELDVWYVDHLTFWLDVKILFLTIGKVFKGEGIAGENSATMERFIGNKKPGNERA